MPCRELAALAVRTKAEVISFVKFATNSVEKMRTAADNADPATGAADMVSWRNLLFAHVSSMRERIVVDFAQTNAVAGPGLGLHTEGTQRDVLTIVRDETSRLRVDVDTPRHRMRVVAFVGIHGAAKQEYTEAVWRLGGAVCEHLNRGCTHVVVGDGPAASGSERAEQRLGKAAEWGTTVVRQGWLRRSQEQGDFADTKAWEVTPPEEREGRRPAAAGKPGPAATEKTLSSARLRDAVAGLEGLSAALQGQTQRGSATQRSQLAAFAPAAAVAPAPPAGSAARERRVSRRDFTGDPAPPGPGDMGAPAAKRARGGVAGGTANTPAPGTLARAPGGAADRLPPAPPPPRGDGIVGTVPGHESQRVRWDADASAPAPGGAARAPGLDAAKVFQLSGAAAGGNAKKEEIVAAIRRLGGEVELVPTHMPRATHLCLLADTTPQQTEKYLSFVAAGKWIVSRRYVDESAAAGRWLDECDFAAENERISRHRQRGGRAFDGWTCVLAVQPHIAEGVAAILRAGGAAAVRGGDAWPAAAPAASHVFADTGAELTLPAAAGPAAADTLRGRAARGEVDVLRVEFLYRFLCVEVDYARLVDEHRMRVV